jgi:hypothetical protein
MLQVDASRALRKPEELACLVEAIVGALAADERDWIEWKSGLDLTAKATQGTIARHVLGMANRLPTATASYMEGCGYIVVGAEPGGESGITTVDPAVLSQGILAYTGASDGPAWSPHYVRRASGAMVLVVIVEAPQPGERIRTLRKEFGSGTTTYRAGTVFVRHHGKTEMARPEDIRALEDRYAALALESARRAEQLQRDALEIQQARQADEEIERRRQRLVQLARLTAEVRTHAETILWWKLGPARRPSRKSERAERIVASRTFGCPEQSEMQSVITGMDMTGMASVASLAAADQVGRAYDAAARAKIEIDAALSRLRQSPG